MDKKFPEDGDPQNDWAQASITRSWNDVRYIVGCRGGCKRIRAGEAIGHGNVSRTPCLHGERRHTRVPDVLSGPEHDGQMRGTRLTRAIVHAEISRETVVEPGPPPRPLTQTHRPSFDDFATGL
jgi:hypothetical protein